MHKAMNRGIHHIIACIGLPLLACATTGTPGNEPPQLRGTTLRGDTVAIAAAEGERVIIIFYNTYSCHDCFLWLDTALRIAARDHPTLRPIVLARVGSSMLARRTALTAIAQSLPSLPEILFDITEPGITDPWPPSDLQGGIFGRYTVSRTPALLFVGWKAEPIHRSYESMFAEISGAAPQVEVEHLVHIIDDPAADTGR